MRFYQRKIFCFLLVFLLIIALGALFFSCKKKASSSSSAPATNTEITSFEPSETPSGSVTPPTGPSEKDSAGDVTNAPNEERQPSAPQDQTQTGQVDAPVDNNTPSGNSCETSNPETSKDPEPSTDPESSTDPEPSGDQTGQDASGGSNDPTEEDPTVDPDEPTLPTDPEIPSGEHEVDPEEEDPSIFDPATYFDLTVEKKGLHRYIRTDSGSQPYTLYAGMDRVATVSVRSNGVLKLYGDFVETELELWGTWNDEGPRDYYALFKTLNGFRKISFYSSSAIQIDLTEADLALLRPKAEQKEETSLPEEEQTNASDPSVDTSEEPPTSQPNDPEETPSTNQSADPEEPTENQPSNEPTGEPTNEPTGEPTDEPTGDDLPTGSGDAPSDPTPTPDREEENGSTAEEPESATFLCASCGVNLLRTGAHDPACPLYAEFPADSAAYSFLNSLLGVREGLVVNQMSDEIEDYAIALVFPEKEAYFSFLSAFSDILTYEDSSSREYRVHAANEFSEKHFTYVISVTFRSDFVRAEMRVQAVKDDPTEPQEMEQTHLPQEAEQPTVPEPTEPESTTPSENEQPRVDCATDADGTRTYR